MQNIEIKTALDSIPKMERRLQQIEAQYQGILRQVDTYFRCPSGRLKLREINGKRFELIYYQRPNSVGSKQSRYQIVTMGRRVARDLKQALSDAYGVTVIIKKTRRLWLYHHTRIHLDRVAGLGIFFELETVISNQTVSQGKKEQRKVLQLLDIQRLTVYRQSYSDMLMGKSGYRHRKSLTR